MQVWIFECAGVINLARADQPDDFIITCCLLSILAVELDLCLLRADSIVHLLMSSMNLSYAASHRKI